MTQFPPPMPFFPWVPIHLPSRNLLPLETQGHSHLFLLLSKCIAPLLRCCLCLLETLKCFQEGLIASFGGDPGDGLDTGDGPANKEPLDTFPLRKATGCQRPCHLLSSFNTSDSRRPVDLLKDTQPENIKLNLI